MFLKLARNRLLQLLLISAVMSTACVPIQAPEGYSFNLDQQQVDPLDPSQVLQSYSWEFHAQMISQETVQIKSFISEKKTTADHSFGYDLHLQATLATPATNPLMIFKDGQVHRLEGFDPTELHETVQQDRYFVGNEVFDHQGLGNWQRLARDQPMSPAINNRAQNILPLQLATIFKSGKILGIDIVNGVLTTHFQYQGANIVDSSQYGPELSEAINNQKAVVDLWYAIDRPLVVKYIVHFEGQSPAFNPRSYQVTYDVQMINQAFEIDVPDEVKEEIAKKEQALLTNELAHPTCNTCIFPVPPNARNIDYTYSTTHDNIRIDLTSDETPWPAIKHTYLSHLREYDWDIINYNDLENIDVGRFTISNDTYTFTITVSPTMVRILLPHH